MNLQKFNDQIFAHQKSKENPEVVVIVQNEESEVLEVQYNDGRIEIICQ